MPVQTAEELRAIATAGPPSGFDPNTGDLTIAGVVYKPRKFTNARRKEMRKLDKDRDNAKLVAASMQIAGKFDLVGDTPTLKVGQTPPTEEEMTAVQDAADELQDTLFYKLPLLFAADGQVVDVDQAMEELTDAEAFEAVAFAMENPTTLKLTGATSS